MVSYILIGLVVAAHLLTPLALRAVSEYELRQEEERDRIAREQEKPGEKQYRLRYFGDGLWGYEIVRE